MRDLGQIIGFIGTISFIVSCQMPGKKKILIWQAAATIFCSIQFMLFGKLSGTLTELLIVIESIVFYFDDKPHFNRILMSGLFIAASIFIAVFTWENTYSLLPAVGIIFSTVALIFKDDLKLRLFLLAACGPWIIFDIHVDSYSGILMNIFIAVSLIFAIIRYNSHWLHCKKCRKINN